MKALIKFLKYFFLFLLSLILILYITGNSYVLKGIKLVYLKGRTTANIFDAKDFENNVVAKDSEIIEILKDSVYNKYPLSKTLRSELTQFETTAFLVLKEDEIFQEVYWDTDSYSRSNSFSMAKTLTTLLVQKAIEDGKINSWNDPMTQYIPEYKKDSLAKYCTLADLSKMTSGFDWNESYYFPINPTANAYYGTNMDKVMLDRKFTSMPGKSFKYLSGNTQLLGYALKSSLKGETISNYLSDKFWKPLKMTEGALWTVDHKDGIEKTYCCVHANARDFSKFGSLLLHHGKMYGKQLIDSAFINKMISPTKESDGHYGYSIWTETRHTPHFYFLRGHLGQYVIVIPEFNVVIVRLGQKRDNRPFRYEDKYFPNEIYIYVDETLKSLKEAKLIP